MIGEDAISENLMLEYMGRGSALVIGDPVDTIKSFHFSRPYASSVVPRIFELRCLGEEFFYL